MKNVQDLSFKINSKRNGKSYNDGHRSVETRLQRKNQINFKLRKARLAEEYLN